MPKALGETPAPWAAPTSDRLFSFLSSPAATHLLSGAIAGGVSRTFTAPLDRLKVVLQVTHSHRAVTAIGTFRDILREEGIVGFYRGNGVNCIKVVPECAIKFVAYDWFKRRIIASRHRTELFERCTDGSHELNALLETESSVPLGLIERIIAGAAAGHAFTLWKSSRRASQQ